jgi:hypothetical protein
LAHGVGEVAENRLDERKSAAVAAALLRCFEASGFQERFAAGLLGAHPGAQVVLDLHPEVALQLLRQLTILAALV